MIGLTAIKLTVESLSANDLSNFSDLSSRSLDAGVALTASDAESP